MKHTILSVTNRINLLENRQKENGKIVQKLRRELRRLLAEQDTNE